MKSKGLCRIKGGEKELSRVRVIDRDSNHDDVAEQYYIVAAIKPKLEDLPWCNSNEAIRTGGFEQALTSDPSTSHWLKEQIERTKERDPVDALNDAEALVSVLQSRLKPLAEE